MNVEDLVDDVQYNGYQSLSFELLERNGERQRCDRSLNSFTQKKEEKGGKKPVKFAPLLPIRAVTSISGP